MNMNTHQNQNPFLNSTEVSTAMIEACQSYLDLLDVIQRRGYPHNRKEVRHSHEQNLSQYMTAASAAAYAGNISAASFQLAYIVREWGLWKAHDDVIKAKQYLNPMDLTVVNAFEQAVQHNTAYWATLLLNRWSEGERDRKNDQVDLAMQRQGQEALHAGYVDLDHMQSNALAQAHEAGQQYADTALRGVQQAQQSIEWMMEQSARLNQQAGQQAQQSIEWMMEQSARLNQQAGQQAQWVQQGIVAMYQHGVAAMEAARQTQMQFNERLAQESPRAMEKAKLNGCLTRGGIVIAVLFIGVPTLFLIAYVLVTMVVLPH